MPNDQNTEVIKFILVIIGSFMGIINMYALKALGALKEADKDLYTRVNNIDTRLSRQEATCEERHKK